MDYPPVISRSEFIIYTGFAGAVLVAIGIALAALNSPRTGVVFTAIGAGLLVLASAELRKGRR